MGEASENLYRDIHAACLAAAQSVDYREMSWFGQWRRAASGKAERGAGRHG